MSRSIFLSVFLTLFILADFYIYSGVKQITQHWTANNQRVLFWVYWSIPVLSIALLITVFFVFPDRINLRTKTWVGSGIFIVSLSKLFAAAILLLGDVLRLSEMAIQKTSSLFKKTSEPNLASDLPKITRSAFITKAALAVGATHVGAMTWGIISGAHDYRIRRVPLKLKNLPSAFHGLKLIQVSDIHSGSFFNKTAVEGGVDMLLNEKPDMVFFTGDLVNNEATELKDYFDVFKRIKAPLGVYSTLGNHDYGDYTQWASAQAKAKNLDTLIQGHKLMGWDILMDENRSIRVDGEQIGVLGIQNWGQGFSQHGDLKQALQGSEEFPVKLLLSHDPSHWRAQVLNQTNIDVSFAGHTHGMQYGVEIGNFKWSPVQWRYKEWAGLYKENEQQLYVNRGYGYLGYPGRLGILPEITVFELQKA
ncbi:metallophosphoesterase [Marinilongibacter aquaticus]|uniref:metallophosphoesterase n=1 Tax=Marinilongibacter aquaticus TaxID=2975157 RepID=UPI0021BD61EF|nr:metallophosphoesterase [Marinilongibacter aquaticus]UBM57862.1 metallophosphoesterase [Marinilongibacter aquaticus]